MFLLKAKLHTVIGCCADTSTKKLVDNLPKN